jgi:ABC-type nitrate/sulfonate/bicarbonate transport system permease component
MLKRLVLRALPALTVIFFIAAWQAFVDLRDIPPIYLPSPLAIGQALLELSLDGTILRHLGATLLRILTGFLLATVCGIALGLLMGMSRLAARIADPWIAALYPLPKISLIPLLIIWMGTGEGYKIVISAVTAFFPIAMSTYAGVRQVDRGLMQAARDLGASPRQVQLKIVLPGAVPSIFSGLQLGMGVTIILVVAAEMIGGSSRSGLGWLLVHAGQVMETETVFAALVVLALMGAAIIKAQQWLDRILAPWADLHSGEPR